LFICLFCPGWPGTKIFPFSASHESWDDRDTPLHQVIFRLSYV
jgi:hypothetical protein